ncbi:MAG: glucosamine-6-phosphate synthase, partial [Actinomycetota bacterium]
MCGIIGIVSRPSSRPVPAADDVIALLDAAVAAGDELESAARHLAAADALLRGDAGITALAGNLTLASEMNSRLDRIDTTADAAEAVLDAMHGDSATIDTVAARVSAVRDASWALRRDRLRTADAVHALAGAGAAPHTLHGYLSVQQALSAIDRMEVRGRDSAGVSVVVWGADLSAVAARFAEAIARRGSDPLFTNNSIRTAAGNMVFVYKAAAEIGELGDNTRNMRAAVAADEVLRAALGSAGARVTVLGHTRWASVGIISEPNAHPVTGEEVGSAGDTVSIAVLNGDVDNHADLKARHGLRFADPITTDAKVIPALVDRLRPADGSVDGAFRAAVSQFEGSVAVGYCDAAEPGRLLFALSGSGQGCYVGIAEDRFVVASEPYGVVEETSAFVRLDGETPVDPVRPTSRGQVAVLHADAAGTVAGITMS